MNVCISIAEHELEMAHRWFSWVSDLGGTDGHNLYLIPSAGLDISALIPKANSAFRGRVKIIKDEEEQTSDWQNTEQLRSASGPNSAFRQVAWHFYMNKLGPYFWCELDCVPTHREWLDRFDSEYKVAISKGKKFVGAHVQIESVPEHMSGNAVYVNVPEEAPGLVQRTNWTPKGQLQSFELAFDIAGAKDVLPKAHFTNLIQHKFRFKGFESRAEFDAVIDPNAVVFHSDKSGSIYKYLRENLSGSVGVTERKQSSGEGAGMAFDSLVPAVSGDAAAQEPSPAQPTSELSPSPFTVLRFARMMDDELESKVKSEHVNLSSGVEIATGGRQGNGDPNTPSTASEMVKFPVETPLAQTSCETTVVSKTFTPSDELEKVIAQNSVIKNGLPAMSPPWENREDSERDVKMLCDALALFTKSPVYKHRVRQALREAKIIK